MSEDALFCRCGGEVGLVRINAEILTLGHKVQPKDRHHYVRLAPAARNGGIPVPSTGQPKVSGASDTSRTSIGTRAARNGRDRTASPPVATPDVLDREGRPLTNPLSGRSLGCFPRPSLSSASRRS